MRTLQIGRRAALAALAMVPVMLAIGETAEAEEKTIRLLRAPVGAFEPLYIAQEKGYFKEKG
jgi:NitT/TauT family transport system substrate-binding protein